MCDMSLSVEHDNKDENTKEHQLEHILSENMRMLEDSKENDDFGYYLSVSPDDHDSLHLQEHKAFRESNKLKPQAKSYLLNHESKHTAQMKEKKRMGLSSDDSETPKEETPSNVKYVNQS